MTTQSLFRAVLLVSSTIIFPAVSHAGFMEVNFSFGAPPPLPVYEQPACPSPGFIWTPGYWAFDTYADQYFWVPGTWVEAPALGLLWTPGYWDESSAGYIWHDGYWASDVGFYGGIDYGFGYPGSGFVGGYWHGRDFFYNRAVVNVTNLNVRNVYSRTVADNYRNQHISFNGPHGIQARPSMADLRAQHETHFGFTAMQRRHADDARSVPANFASANRVHPAFAATSRAAFHNASPRIESRTTSAPTTPAVHAYVRTGNNVRAENSAPSRQGAHTARPPTVGMRSAMPARIPASYGANAARFAGQRGDHSGGVPPQARAPARGPFQTPPIRTIPQPPRPSAPPQVAYHPATPPHAPPADPYRKGRRA